MIAMEMENIPHTIGSQFLITLSDGNGLNNLVSLGDENGTGDKGGEDNAATRKGHAKYLSLGTVAEDSQDVLSKLNRAYCDDDGRPFADIRIQRALVLHDPFDDPEGMDRLLKQRGVEVNQEEQGLEGYSLAPQSPSYDKPPEETVSVRIQADDTTLFPTVEEQSDEDEDEETKQKRLELQQKQEEEWKQKQDNSRAVMLEMLGDLPSAEIKAPENVLFVCKLNPFTNDEDLELIFSRFDQNAKAEIIRDPDTGSSLQYAFVEFTSNEACNEAYLKMNNALVDDRRIRVDFSQSVAKVWDRYHKQYRKGLGGGVDRQFMDGGGRSGGRGGGGRGRGGRGFPGRGTPNQHHHQQDRRFHNNSNSRGERNNDQRRREGGSSGKERSIDRQDGKHVRKDNPDEVDEFGRVAKRNEREVHRNVNHRRHSNSRSHSPSGDVNRRRRSRSGSANSSRSRSEDSDHSRRRRHKKRHKKEHRRERKHRSRSRDRDKKKRKKHPHSSEHRHHRCRDEYSDDEYKTRDSSSRKRERDGESEREERKSRHRNDGRDHHRRHHR